jgi:hypothetical protein
MVVNSRKKSDPLKDSNKTNGTTCNTMTQHCIKTGQFILGCHWDSDHCGLAQPSLLSVLSNDYVRMDSKLQDFRSCEETVFVTASLL